MIKTKAFRIQEYNKNSTLVIYGASVYGEIARTILSTHEIVPDYFCDRSKKKKEYYSIPVITLETLCTLKNVNIIIASADFFYEIRDELYEKGFKNLYDMSEILKVELDTDLLSNRAKEVYNSRDYYINIVNSQDDRQIVLNRIQYVVTEKCSLRCKDCSHLMPYYKNPIDVDLEKNRKAFELLLENVDYIGELRILGGEPFIHPKMYQLIEWYSNQEIIREISVYTNGTIIPSESTLFALQREKVKVHISDYGINVPKIKNLVNVFDEYKIRYFVRAYDEWQDAGGVHDRRYSEEVMKDHFGVCFERNGYTFLHGRLYRCPRSAHGINLGAIPDRRKDYIDLINWKGTQEELKKRIAELQNLQFLESCRFCSGPDNHQKGIPAAIQTKEVLKF